MPEILRSRIYSDGESQVLLLPAELGIEPGQLLEIERIGETIRLRLIDEKATDEG